MKSVVSLKDLEDLVRQGKDPRAIADGALLTPSARDFLQELDGHRHGAPLGKIRTERDAGIPSPPQEERARERRPFVTPVDLSAQTKVTAKSAPAELEAFFNSAAMEDLKLQLCDIGRRLWQRAYVDGNGGNIAIRVGPDLALCTPTLVSKGFMKPEDMCLVNLEGEQLGGSKKRTSEILMHLQIMKRQPRAVATVHCHPPYATGFAVAGVEPPNCMIPEYEVFSSVAIAPYRTPGTPEMGKLVADLVDKHNTILMANHGVVAWSHNNVEDAYFKMEIIEAYCRTVLVSAQLGRPPNTFTPAQLQDLLRIKQSLGIPDPRYGLKECELCDNSAWRPGVTCAPCSVNGAAANDGSPNAEAEALIQAITDQILSAQR